MNKKVTLKLSKKQRAQQEEIKRRDAKLQKESEALRLLKKQHIMETITEVGLFEPELDAFVSALDGNPHLNDIVNALMVAAQSKGVDLAKFQVKLARMGFIL